MNNLLAATLDENLQGIITKLQSLMDSFWIYIVMALAAVVVVWGAYVGIKIAIAHKKCNNLSEYLLITNGHDFVNLFCRVATNTYGQASIRAIETTLRGTFGIADFKTTTLYKNLSAYQTINKIKIVS